MGKLSRDKGKRIELEIVSQLKEAFPLAARNWSEQMERSSGKDIIGTPGFIFQVKGGKKPNWKTALSAAFQEAFSGGLEEIPVGITREDRQPPIVHMYLVDLIDILKNGRPRPQD